MRIDVARVQVERAHQELLDLGGGVGLDLQAHGGPAAALAHLLLDRLEQVLDLVVVDLVFAVAGDAEDGGVLELHAGEQLRQVQADDRLQRRRRRGRLARAGSGTKRGSTRRHLHHGEQLLAVSRGRCSSTARLSDLLSRCGNGWPGSMASGVSTGKISRRNTSCRCLRSASVRSLRPRMTMPSRSRAGSTSSSRQAILRRRPSGATTWPMRSSCSRGGMRSAPEPNGDAGLHLLLQAADADHEELVEVGAEDGQELEPLQQRHLRVLGLLQHAAVELQPAQLAVDVQGRIVKCRHRRPLWQAGRSIRRRGWRQSRAWRTISTRVGLAIVPGRPRRGQWWDGGSSTSFHRRGPA